MKKYALGALALTLSAGLVGTAIPAQADAIALPATSDPAPVARAGAYLAAQPEDTGIIRTYYVYGDFSGDYPDYGLTVDAGFALDAAGQQPAALATMTGALRAGINDYAKSGASRAKLSSFLLSLGLTGQDIDDLVTALETHIATGEGIEGRLTDAEPNDFNSPLTQAYAVSALHDAGSGLAASALSFLLDQQCSDGFFRGSFSPKDADDQTCDGASSPASGSIDTTGLALLMLADQAGATEVDDAIGAALDWLAFEQAGDGSFNSGNANSTGLAGWALGLHGYTDEAADAAAWVRAHQLANAGSCAPFAAADNGAITLDDLGYANAQAGPFDQVDNSVATRSTTQALPALLWADGGAAQGENTVTATTDLVKAGSLQPVEMSGAPGNTVCVSARNTHTAVVLDEDGEASSSVQLPGRTRTTVVSVVDAGGETDEVSITGLAKKKVPFKVAKKVRRGKKVVVKVKGLVAGESVLVRFRGKKVATAEANNKGKKTLRFVATGLGKGKVLVRGEFGDRRNAKVIRVVR